MELVLLYYIVWLVITCLFHMFYMFALEMDSDSSSLYKGMSHTYKECINNYQNTELRLWVYFLLSGVKLTVLFIAQLVLLTPFLPFYLVYFIFVYVAKNQKVRALFTVIFYKSKD